MVECCQAEGCSTLVFKMDISNGLQLAFLVLQIIFPDELDGPETSAESRLKHVIRSCLQTNPKNRPTAAQVQAALHAIMKDEDWSDDLAKYGSYG